MEKLYTVAQASDITGLSKGTLSRWLSEGRIPRTKIGRATRIRESALAALITDGGKDEAQAERCRKMVSNRKAPDAQK